MQKTSEIRIMTYAENGHEYIRASTTEQSAASMVTCR